MQLGRLVSHSFYHTVCVQDYCKSNQPISLKLGVMTGPTNRKNINFWWWSSPEYGFLITFSLHRSGIKDLFAFLHTVAGRFSRHSVKRLMPGVMSPQHFRCDLENVRIRIRIDLEIWIQIPDHFQLKLVALSEVCTLRAGCTNVT